MAIGDIDSAVIETFEFETSTAGGVTVLKLSPGVVAIWYQGVDIDGFLKTYPVDAAGDIGPLIDSWEFETAIFIGPNYHPGVVNVSGNIFAAAYRGDTNILYVRTMTVAPDGTITKTVIDTGGFASQPIVANIGGFIKKPGTTKYIAFWDEGGASPDGHMAVVNIDNDGTNISLDDSWEFDTPRGKLPIIIHISGDVFAITYNNGSGRIIKTFQVADNGTITKSFLDTETFGSDTGNYHYIVLVSGSVYAIFSDGGQDVKTFTIDGSGIITAIDTGIFFTTTNFSVTPIKFNESGTIAYFAYSLYKTGWTSYVVTLSISTSGIIGSVIDSLLVDNNWQGGFQPIEVQRGIFLFPWKDTPGGDGFISSVGISNPIVYPTDPLLRVSGIRRTFWAGVGGQSVYQTEIVLGGLSTTFISPIGSREPQGAVPPQELPAEEGLRHSDYLAWLNSFTSPQIIFLIFGKMPSYEDWVAFKQAGKI